MIQPNNPSEADLFTYRSFLARLIAGWLFIIFLFLWIIKALPHHFPEQAAGDFVHPETNSAYALVWMMTSTSLLFFLIVPGRLLAVLLIVLMTAFVYCYTNGGLSLINPAFIIALLPFAVPISWFSKSWRAVKWILLFFLALHSWFLPLSWKALPGYSLYFIPFIPWGSLFAGFVRRFEPK